MNKQQEIDNLIQYLLDPLVQKKAILMKVKLKKLVELSFAQGRDFEIKRIGGEVDSLKSIIKDLRERGVNEKVIRTSEEVYPEGAIKD